MDVMTIARHPSKAMDTPKMRARLLGCMGGALLVGGLLVSPSIMAMEMLADNDLAGVSGQDGLTIDLHGANGWSADAIQWTGDDTSTISLNNVTVDGVGPNGITASAPPASAQLTIDTGAAPGPTPLMSLGFHTTNRIRLRTDSLTIPTAANARSMGTWAFDFEGGIDLINSGIFNMGFDQAYLLGEIQNADLFYRQGDDTSPWMAMHDFTLRWEIPEGVLGISDEGLVHRAGTPYDPNDPGAVIPDSTNLASSDLINLALDFEFVFGQKAGAEEFAITTDARGLMHFGWLGSIRNAEIKWMPGGVWQTASPTTTSGGNTYDAFDPYGVNAVTSEGLRFSSQWDYVNLDDIAANGGFLTADNEFRWRLGETADVASSDLSRINFELGDWVMWGERNERKPSPHYFPLIAIDVINGAGQGPGGLCWGHGINFSQAGCTAEGGQFMNVQPGRIGNYYGFSHAGDSGALAVIVRDGQLQTYSRKVRLIERASDGTRSSREFDWGLIYSLANIDANIYLYPGGTVYDSGSGSYVAGNGVIADILVKSQTLDDNYELQARNWDHGTHLMIGDTAANMGIGFMSSSFVVAGNDTRIWVKPQEGADYYSGGIDIFSPEARFNYRATFGGGLLPEHPEYGNTSRAQTVVGAALDMNLEGLVNLRFSPSDPAATNGDNYLGFSGALSLGSNYGDGMLGATTNLSTCGSDGSSSCGTYLSIAEPSQPDAAIKLANITGDLAFTEGRVDVVGTGERASSPEPKMQISNNIKVGYAAADHLGSILDTVPGLANTAGQPVIIDSIMLGNAKIGSMVIPSAQIHSSITLEPQSAAVSFSP